MKSAGEKKAAPRGRQARGLTTRTKILEAVLGLVADGGIDAVTYRAVAEAAGVAQGVMTYHFASRRDLLAQAFRLHHEKLRDSAIELPIDELRQLGAEQRAQAVFEFVRSMVGADRARYLAEFEIMLEIARDPELRREVDPAAAQMDAFAYDMLVATGSPQPRADALLLSAALEGLVLEWLARPDDRDFGTTVRAAVTRLVEIFFPVD